MKGMKMILALAALATLMVLSATETTHAADWVVGGQILTSEGILGSKPTSSFYDVSFILNNERVLKLDYISPTLPPNIIGGESINYVLNGVYGATICGGGLDYSSGTDYPNGVTDYFGFVGGGAGNQAGSPDGDLGSQDGATVCGGYLNQAAGRSSFIGGGNENLVQVYGGTVCGGEYNYIVDNYGFVGGGSQNQAGRADGDPNNQPFATVCGGQNNLAWDDYSFIGGGYSNYIEPMGESGTICGGYDNNVTGPYGTICGGISNEALDSTATVGGGGYNEASGQSATVGGGNSNEASGQFSTVPGGLNNIASNWYTFAAGVGAVADSYGCFMLSDSQMNYVPCAGINTFNVRASGGIWFGTTSSPSIGANRFINTSTGAYLTTSGIWTNAPSTAEYKKDIEPADGEAIMELLRQLPINEWTHIVDPPEVRHIGPMADDFHDSLGLGDGLDGIAASDMAGVALAAIQALDQKVQVLEAEVSGMKVQAAKLQGLDEELKGRMAQITELQERLAKIEKERNAAPVKRAALTDVNQVGLIVLALLLAGAIGLVSRRSRA